MALAYYNEIDPFAAQWLRNLIDKGLIASGDVDERSIEDVRPSDLAGYTQCHFFAGIGGWSYALRLAGWPDDRPAWTGSCPCQPFSAAGKELGFADERHLWPAWNHLVRECHPPVIFGEQVEAAIRHGWLDLVQADLEGEGYRFGAAGLPAAGVGAGHGRARLWFVADGMVQPDGPRPLSWSSSTETLGYGGSIITTGSDGSVADAEEQGLRARHAELHGDSRDPLGNPDLSRPQGLIVGRNGSDQRTAGQASLAGFWADAEWLWCRDQKYRPVEPGTFPLAHGVPNRVGRLRGYGNAIVPQVAEQFIRAYCEAREEGR